MILTDGVHLVSDKDVPELHMFARRLGLKLEWFQEGRIPHYDIFGRVAMNAAEAGIEFVSTRELVKRAARHRCRGECKL